MTRQFESHSPFSHLLHIETHLQEEPDLGYSYCDVEHVPLYSIEEVREELQARYRDVVGQMHDPEAGNANPIGVIYDYSGILHHQGEPRDAAHLDYVRVFELSPQPVEPHLWMPQPAIKESHLEEELADALQALLDCPDLNLDELETVTLEARRQAEHVLAQVRKRE